MDQGPACHSFRAQEKSKIQSPNQLQLERQQASGEPVSGFRSQRALGLPLGYHGCVEKAREDHLTKPGFPISRRGLWVLQWKKKKIR